MKRKLLLAVAGLGAPDLTPRMIQALRDIDTGTRGTDQRTEKPLRDRGLVVPSDEWPYVTLTDAGRAAIADQ
jgi:hypothetical protein